VVQVAVLQKRTRKKTLCLREKARCSSMNGLARGKDRTMRGPRSREGVFCQKKRNGNYKLLSGRTLLFLYRGRSETTPKGKGRNWGGKTKVCSLSDEEELIISEETGCR